MAGGSGTRLRASGIGTPKPLLEVLGRPLISWTLDEMRVAGIERVSVAIRRNDFQLRTYLHQYARTSRIEIEIHEQNLDGTLAAIELLSRSLSGQLVISTCDIVCIQGTFQRFLADVNSYEATTPLAAFATTSLVHDADPIWVEVDDTDPRFVRNVGKNLDATNLCFGNFRWLSVPGIDTMRRIINSKFPVRDSELLGMLARLNPKSVLAIDVGPVLDVDNREDLEFVSRHGEELFSKQSDFDASG